MTWEPGAPVPLSQEAFGQWTARVERADRLRKTEHEPAWDKALERYRHSKDSQYDVNPLLEFRHVESKKSQLFYQTPDVQLHPVDPHDQSIPLVQVLPLRQKVLNYKLGPDGVNIKREIHATLFDCLAASGWLVTELGYENRTAPAIDPLTQQPMRGPDGKVVQIAVWGRCFWGRRSPKKLLVPDDWASTDFDQAPWLGLKGTLAVNKGRAIGWDLPKDFEGTTQADQDVFEHEQGKAVEAVVPLLEYTKIWYRAEYFDESIKNPDLFRQLVLVKGLDTPARHVNSPFQELDPAGRLTDASMIGNPIHVGTLRDLSDSAYIDADLVVGSQLSNEVGKYRTQLVKNRVARTPLTAIDPDGFEPTEVDKIKKGDKVVFTKPGILIGGQQPVQTMQVGQEPRDNYAAQDRCETDWEKALGTSANRQQSAQQKSTSATEARIIESSANARDEQERDRLREYFIAGVRKFDGLLQRYMLPQEVEKILGQQGTQLWAQWRSMAGRYVYKILTDSGIHVDAAQHRQQVIGYYNMLRKDPVVNPVELVTQTMRALGFDPAKSVISEPPEAAPEPIRVSLAFKGEDLIGPQSQAVVEILAQQGAGEIRACDAARPGSARGHS